MKDLLRLTNCAAAPAESRRRCTGVGARNRRARRGRAFVDDIRTVDPSDDPPSWLAIVLVQLGITIPLAWRRRFPLWVVVIVTATFLVGQSVEVPEGSISYLAVALAIYSAAAHGERPFRTPVLTICVGAIVAELTRVLFIVPSAGDISPLLQTFLLAYNAVLLPWGLGAVDPVAAREQDGTGRSGRRAASRTRTSGMQLPVAKSTVFVIALVNDG